MNSLTQDLTPIHQGIVRAVEAIEADNTATPELRAVVREFHRVSHKAMEAAASGDDQAAIYALLELEQAGDSAKAAADAATDFSSEAAEAIVSAHDEVAALKKQLTLA